MKQRQRKTTTQTNVTQNTHKQSKHTYKHNKSNKHKQTPHINTNHTQTKQHINQCTDPNVNSYTNQIIIKQPNKTNKGTTQHKTIHTKQHNDTLYTYIIFSINIYI